MKILALGLLFLIASCNPVIASQHEETRCCVEPKRNHSGEIVRRADVLRAFKRIYPCPSTMQTSGACPGWAIDHVIPLKCGGVDAVGNLQWLPNAIKSCAGDKCKDRWERKIYCKAVWVTLK